MNALTAVNTIKRTSSFDRNELNRQSYYKSVITDDKTIYMRISNHHTMLYRWVQHRDMLDVSYNISITFSDNMSYPSIRNTNVFDETITAAGEAFNDNFMFTVHGYMYDMSQLTYADVHRISNALNDLTAGRTEYFEDPFEDDLNKKAKRFLLSPNQEPEILETWRFYSDEDIDDFRCIVESVIPDIKSQFNSLTD